MTPRRDLTIAAACIVVGLWASSAPSMLYPEYQRALGLGFIGTTALFAIYPAVLLAGLFVTGGLSDRIGRSVTLSTGLTLVGIGAAVSLLPISVLGVFASRALEGAGVSLLLPAANAWLGDLLAARARGARLASTVNSTAAAAGTILALLVGAMFVDQSRTAALISQWPLLLTAALTAAACLRWRDPAPTVAYSRPAVPALPEPDQRVPFWIGSVAGAAGYAVATLFLSLGAHIGFELTDLPSAIADAASLALFPLATALVPWLTVSLSERAALTLGGIASALGMMTLLVTSSGGGGATFAIAALLSGAGFGLLSRGGTALVQHNSPAGRRAGALATMSIVLYAAQATTALAAGATAEALGLEPAVLTVAPVVALTALTTVVVSRRLGRPASPAEPDPSRRNAAQTPQSPIGLRSVIAPELRTRSRPSA